VGESFNFDSVIHSEIYTDLADGIIGVAIICGITGEMPIVDFDRG